MRLAVIKTCRKRVRFLLRPSHCSEREDSYSGIDTQTVIRGFLKNTRFSKAWARPPGRTLRDATFARLAFPASGKRRNQIRGSDRKVCEANSINDREGLPSAHPRTELVHCWVTRLPPNHASEPCLGTMEPRAPVGEIDWPTGPGEMIWMMRSGRGTRKIACAI